MENMKQKSPKLTLLADIIFLKEISKNSFIFALQLNWRLHELDIGLHSDQKMIEFSDKSSNNIDIYIYSCSKSRASLRFEQTRENIDNFRGFYRDIQFFVETEVKSHQKDAWSAPLQCSIMKFVEGLGL